MLTHSGQECFWHAFKNVGGPVAGLALATLVFEFLAVIWACVVWRKAKAGDVDAPGNRKDVPMDNM